MRLWTISVKVSITEPTERCKMTGRLEASTILSILINYTLYDMNTKKCEKKTMRNATGVLSEESVRC